MYQIRLMHNTTKWENFKIFEIVPLNASSVSPCCGSSDMYFLPYRLSPRLVPMIDEFSTDVILLVDITKNGGDFF